jgi:membrane protein DedA with SNARE-associated domain
MHALVQWLLDSIGSMGYPGIFLLMAMESSIIPVPSELVMPPAGYLAFQGKMNMATAILCGTLGSLAGAYANYYASHYLGRPLIIKYGINKKSCPHNRRFKRNWQSYLPETY